MQCGNLYQNIPSALPQEIFTSLVVAKDVKIERIVSRGHHSDPDFWFDQEQDDWVL
jgi:cupin 2 domain-containing protein